MKFSAIITNPSPSIFYRDNEVLFYVYRKDIFLGNKCKILDSEKNEILSFKIKNKLFSSLGSIDLQNQQLPDMISLERSKHGYTLKTGNAVINIIRKNKIFGKYEGEFLINGQRAGSISEEYLIPNSRYVFNFEKEAEFNFYCLILFSIISLGYADAG